MRIRTILPLTAAALLFAAYQAPAQKVSPDKLQVVEGHAGVDPETGFVRIRGEIWNRSGQAIEGTSVIVELFDPAGKPIDVTGFLAETKKELGVDLRDGAVAERNYLLPGEVAVFEYLRDPKKLSGARYGSHKLSATARFVEGTAPKASVEGFKFTVDKDGYHTVSGTIRNSGTVPCRSPKAVLGFYAPDGKVALATYEEPEEMFQKRLAPGQTIKFFRKSIPTPAGLTIKDVKAWGDCANPD